MLERLFHTRRHPLLVAEPAEQIDGALVAVHGSSQVVAQRVDDADVVVAVGDAFQVADLRAQVQALLEAVESTLVVRAIVMHGAEAAEDRGEIELALQLLRGVQRLLERHDGLIVLAQADVAPANAHERLEPQRMLSAALAASRASRFSERARP
jgi:hypothetical protein